jgi:uncharacterized membrane protein YkvA (DUF1232 family)
VARGLRSPKDLGEVVDLVRRLPAYMRLVWALLRDGRVPAQQKLILAGIAAYLFLPVDLIPDFVPVLGQLDDFAVVLLGLDLFIRGAPSAVVDEHMAKIAQDKDQLRRDIGEAERLLGDRFSNVRDTVERLRTRGNKTRRRTKGGSE